MSRSRRLGRSGSDAANGPSYIVDSYNSGSITGHSDKNYCGIGGLVGKLDASSSRTYEQSYVHNCYNVGTVTDLGLKTINAGAAIGLMHADYSTDSYLEVENVYYLACGLEGLGKMNYSTMHDPSVFAEMTAEAMKAPTSSRSSALPSRLTAPACRRSTAATPSSPGSSWAKARASTRLK